MTAIISCRSDFEHVANFKLNDQSIQYVGHMIDLTIGGKKLEQEFNFRDPMSPMTDVGMALTINSREWSEAAGDPISFVGYVGERNWSKLRMAISDADKSRECEFTPTIYMRRGESTFIKTFHSDGSPIKGIFIKNECFVGDTPIKYDQITVFEYRLTIVGSKGEEQAFQYDFGSDEKKQMKFGNKT